MEKMGILQSNHNYKLNLTRFFTPLMFENPRYLEDEMYLYDFIDLQVLSIWYE